MRPVHRAQALYASAQGDDAALIQRYGHLVERNARRMARRMPSDHAYDDLWSVGALGLLEAAQRFDAQRGVRFESFAEHRIRGAMLDELRRLDNLPRRLRAQTEGVVKARKMLNQELGRECTADELAVKLEMTTEELGALEAVAQAPQSLDDAMSVSLASEELAVDSKIERSERSEQLAAAISTLSTRLQTLLSLYYVEELTLKEIAQVFEVSEPRVCQLHKEAVTKLKLALAGEPSDL